MFLSITTRFKKGFQLISKNHLRFKWLKPPLSSSKRFPVWMDQLDIMSVGFYTYSLENTICIPMTSNEEATSECSLKHSIEGGDRAGSCDMAILQFPVILKGCQWPHYWRLAWKELFFLASFFHNTVDWSQGVAYAGVKSLHDTGVQCNMGYHTLNYWRGNENLSLFPKLSGYWNLKK